MTCTNCKKNEASFCFVIIENGEKKEYNLCPACAQKLGIFDMAPFSFMDVFQWAELPPEVTCSQCGTTLTELQRTGLVGCEQCYHDLHAGIEPMVHTLQKSPLHKGRTPIGHEAGVLLSQNEVPAIDTELVELQYELKQAIEKEEFEQAAILRDKIKEKKERKGDA